jgi:hypothetical protein
MNIEKKIKFAAFYIYLKLLRTRQGAHLFGAVEHKFYGEVCAAQEMDWSLDEPEARSVRNAFWIRGEFKKGELASQIEALVVSRRLKFGNAILQLTNAIHVARQLGVNKIYHRGFALLPDRAQVDQIQILKDAPANENYLASSFFPNTLLEKICIAPESRYQTVRKLAPSLSLHQTTSAPTDTSRHLYIHIRAGDIFAKTKPHPLYGQPPLSFYLRILKLQRWEKVVLVFENRLNPVIAGLLAFLSAETIPFEIQSDKLDADCARLLEAENIVIGQGTFVYPMLCISDNVRRVFFFESARLREWGLDESKIQFVRVVDKVGTYRDSVLKRWLNNNEQRALMLNYSEDQLDFVD